MKTLLAFAFISIAPHCFAQEQLGDMLRKAVVEEDVNHNLDAAIKQYRAIMDHYTDERATFANALFRLAECYRKLGRSAEADAAFSRLIAQFPEQTALVERSRQLRNTQPTGKSPANDAEMRLLREKYDLAVQQLQEVQRSLELGMVGTSEMTKAESAMIRAQLAMIDRQSVIAPGTGAEQLRKQRRSMLEQLIGIAQKALEAEEQRYKLGVAGTDAVNRRRSELLDLEIELAHLDKK